MVRTKTDPAETKPVVKRVTNESVTFFLDNDTKFRISLFNYIEFDNRLVHEMNREYLYNIVRNLAVFIHETNRDAFEVRFKRPLTNAEINEISSHTHGSITIDIYKILINIKISSDKTKLLISVNQTPILQDEGVMVKDIVEMLLKEVKYHEHSIKRLNQRIDEYKRWLDKKIETKE